MSKIVSFLLLFSCLFCYITAKEIECIDINLDSELIEKKLKLNFEINNSCNVPVYLVNNWWNFEWTYFQGVTTPYHNELRFNRVYFYDDSLKGYLNEVVEKEMSKFNENDIWIIRPNQNINISFTIVFTEKLIKRFKDNDFKYLIKLVFTKDSWLKFEDQRKIKVPILTEKNRNLYSYSYSNSKIQPLYLPKKEYLFKTVEGNLSIKK